MAEGENLFEELEEVEQIVIGIAKTQQDILALLQQIEQQQTQILSIILHPSVAGLRLALGYSAK